MNRSIKLHLWYILTKFPIDSSYDDIPQSKCSSINCPKIYSGLGCFLPPWYILIPMSVKYTTRVRYKFGHGVCTDKILSQFLVCGYHFICLELEYGSYRVIWVVTICWWRKNVWFHFHLTSSWFTFYSFYADLVCIWNIYRRRWVLGTLFSTINHLLVEIKLEYKPIDFPRMLEFEIYVGSTLWKWVPQS